ncbi:MAG: type I-E CRISPR-associated protein Cas7/Cse4/CasC [Clostridiales bacterium]|nr:type I-E CRISPR-associated protein Cas7/Cse4/CasC [Clostridiales bacterium]
MFLQIHYLTSYHASLLNRDDAGLAKRITFGGVPRLRISSQSLKRHWRLWMMDRTDLPTATRTRYFFERQIKRRLVQDGLPEEVAHELTYVLGTQILTSAESREALDRTNLRLKQPILFGEVEADYLVNLIKEAAETGSLEEAKRRLAEYVSDAKSNFRILLQQAKLPAGFEGALFGRFVTSDILTRVDAPVHVAHAFTTHALDTEVDYFTAVDDLAEGETGAAHAGDMELGSGLFYGYVAVDIPLLVRNLTGTEARQWKNEDLEDTLKLLELLVKAVATVSPGAKLGSTAPHARADFILLELGTSQPRSLANAFLKPIELNTRHHAMEQSVEAIARYLDGLETMYGQPEETRFVASLHAWPRTYETRVSLPQAIEGIQEALRSYTR